MDGQARVEGGQPRDVVAGSYRECWPPRLVTFDRNVSGYIEHGLLLAWRQQLRGDLKPDWFGLVLTAKIHDQAISVETLWLWCPKIQPGAGHAPSSAGRPRARGQ